MNHVTKRMRTNLQRLVKEHKGKKLGENRSLTGKGRVTNARIDTIQNFYGRTTRDNKGITEKCPRKSGQFYIIMQALLTNPCIQTSQQVIKVGVIPKGYY